MKPLAQTFTVDPIQFSKGLYLTSVDLFFARKPNSSGYPVSVAVHSVENRIPQGVYMPGSQVFLSADSVSTPSFGDSNDITSIQSTNTRFTFDEPIFLSGGKQYAITARSNDENYRLYFSQVFDFVVGTTDRRANKISGLDDLFTSSSGSIWEPSVGNDLMMKLNKASFTPNTTYYAYLENAEPGKKLLQPNPLLTDSGDSAVTILQEGHGFSKGDYVIISGLDSATTYNGILGSSIMGTREIDAVDWSGYKFKSDSIASSSLRTGGTGVIVSSNVMMDEFNLNLSTLNPTSTSISTSVKISDGGSLGSNRHTGSGMYNDISNFTTITPNEYIDLSSPKLIYDYTNQTNNSSANVRAVRVKVDMSTTDSNVSPLIDLQRSAISSVSNVIDSGGTSSLSYVVETDARSGTSASKHITKPITLENTAVGLKILLAANRPSVADFDVYWRTAGTDDVIGDIGWTLVNKDVTIPADEDPDIFREYSYLVGGIGGNLTPFSVFQLKIVFRSTNSSRVARIKDLRAIALVV